MSLDLPPLHVEMVRVALPGRMGPPACRQPPSPEQDVLIGSMAGVPLCQARRIKVPMPPGWPVTSPPPPPSAQSAAPKPSARTSASSR
ncbi:hypothetical protein [Cyanobium sp. Morenito 9A2]|uniref:hypothetical protein n=1 Tax=Cyanobium sp. Morenito 9A2 TaxID=2823718 RepID=UPI0020CD6D91|nr:hypothetical protein [Cyanobium sp. Morenito 9A2]MCP9849951.1 hypothetical protein [Cyanobium sp. Morenito 9A2]